MFCKYLIGLLLVGVAHCAPNHAKAVVVETGKPVYAYGNLGASASFGPWSASAGLNGAAKGTAQANAVAQGDASGLGTVPAGSSATASASASASAGGGSGAGVHSGPGFFDAIFNIPISVLKTVNTHLNSQDAQQALAFRRAHKQCRKYGNCKPLQDLQAASAASGGVSAGVGGGAVASSDASASAGAGTFSRAGASANAGGQAVGTVGVHKNYDSTFAIPIAALTSVNQFLNGK